MRSGGQVTGCSAAVRPLDGTSGTDIQQDGATPQYPLWDLKGGTRSAEDICGPVPIQLLDQDPARNLGVFFFFGLAQTTWPFPRPSSPTAQTRKGSSSSQAGGGHVVRAEVLAPLPALL